MFYALFNATSTKNYGSLVIKIPQTRVEIIYLKQIDKFYYNSNKNVIKIVTIIQVHDAKHITKNSTDSNEQYQTSTLGLATIKNVCLDPNTETVLRLEDRA